MNVFTIVGIGIMSVFVGLILIIIAIKLMGLLFGKKEKKAPVKNSIVPKITPVDDEDEAEHNKLIALVSASIAADMGTSVNGLRIKSLKKIN